MSATKKLSNRWVQLLLAMSAGAIHFLATPDFSIWIFSWIGFLPLFLALEHASPRRGFFLGLLAGWVGHFGGYYWMTTLLVRFGHLPWAGAIVLHLFFAAYQGFHWSLIGYGICRCRTRLPAWAILMVAPLMLAAGEQTLPLIFDGYLAISQAQILPIIQIAEFTGPIGVSFLLAFVNAGLYYTLKTWFAQRRIAWKSLAVTGGVLGAVLLFGVMRVQQIDAQRNAAPKVKVGVVQGNVGIRDKGQMNLALRHHQMHIELSRELARRGAELILWPESAYPFVMSRNQTADFPEGDPRRVMQGIDASLIFGVMTRDLNGGYPYNSAYMIDRNNQIVGRFDKNFLLIFGEYIPFYKQVPSFRKWFPAASNFNRGHEVAAFPWGAHKISPLICYEDIIPAFTRKVARLQPNLLVNLTNDAWFGLSAAPHQHFALSIYRTVELRLDLVRAVNTGVSAFVEASGRVAHITDVYDPVIQGHVEPVTLLDDAALMPPPNTIYARFGDWFGWLCVAAALYLLLARKLPWRNT